MNSLYDAIGRRINYLRVSVTDRCNFRCQYCMPIGDIDWFKDNDILSYEELIRIISNFAKLGVDKVRITGGEPLMRKGLVSFLSEVSVIPGIQEVVLTTNGSMLEKYAPLLKQAGVKRVNISLDTLCREKFIKLTGQDALNSVLAGINKAQEVGLSPVKINMVVMKNFNSNELADFASLAILHPYQIRFIEYMPFRSGKDYLFTAEEMKRQLLASGFTNLIPEIGTRSSAQVYRFPGSLGTIGFITPVSQHFCSSCNRIRITPDGYLKPCLLVGKEYMLRDQLRAGISDDELLGQLKEIILDKPQDQYETNADQSERGMYRIGG